MNSPRLLFFNVLLIACITAVATDIYAPSLPAIAQIMHTAVGWSQFSLTIFMLGLSISQLIYGPLSEGFGRRIPLITGLLIFTAGCTISIVATNITVLIIGRLIQGLGAGACASLWRTIFRDVYQGDDLAKYGAFLSIFITFLVPAVPILGGYLQSYIGWQASFAFLILYGLSILLMFTYTFKETSQHHHPERLKKSFIVQSFRELLRSPIFMGYTLAVFFCYGGCFAWFTVGPILLIKYIGLSPVEFGWVSFVAATCAMGLGGTINGKVVKRFGGKLMLQFGWITMFAAGCLLMTGQLLFGLHLLVVIIPVTLFFFGATFIWPNAFAGAFTPFGHIAGYAGSLYSFMQLGGGAFIGSLVTWLPASSAFPLAIIFMISPLLAWLCWDKMINRQSLPLSA